MTGKRWRCTWFVDYHCINVSPGHRAVYVGVHVPLGRESKRRHRHRGHRHHRKKKERGSDENKEDGRESPTYGWKRTHLHFIPLPSFSISPSHSSFFFTVNVSTLYAHHTQNLLLTIERKPWHQNYTLLVPTLYTFSTFCYILLHIRPACSKPLP